MFRTTRMTVLIMMLAFTPLAAADTISVPADQLTIQDAIDAAVDGDEVIVAPGTYFENINFNGKAITLRSVDPLDPATVDTTIIDAGGSGRVVTCDSGETPDTVLSGFTITGGLVGSNGAGMRNVNSSSPTVTDCVFSGNSANNVNSHGGGMFNSNGSNPTVIDCVFSGNTSGNLGGGLSNSNNSNPTVSNCVFSGNSADNVGGGMFNTVTHSVVTNCTFVGNSAIDGGGIYNEGGNPTVASCMFIGNTATDEGGGMFNTFGSGANVTNCAFSDNAAINAGGGMYNSSDSDPTVSNCVFSGNTASIDGGGIFNVATSNPTVTNCILWGDSPNEITGGSPSVTFSNVQGGFAGIGNIDTDPLFVDPSGDDLRLAPGSPSIDAGDNAAVPPGIATDLDGNPRFVDDPDSIDTGVGIAPIVDMGAYEFQDTKTLCAADLDDDGVVGAADLAQLLGAWGQLAIDGPSVVAFSDLSPEGTFDSSTGVAVRGPGAVGPLDSVAWAASFTTTESLQLLSIELALESMGASDAVEVLLYGSDELGAPDAPLESLGVLSGIPFDVGDSILQTATSSINTMLETETTYFVVVRHADAQTNIIWYINPLGIDDLPLFHSIDEGPFTVPTFGNPLHPAFRVNGTELLAHPADLNGDGAVGPADLAILLGAWGPCLG